MKKSLLFLWIVLLTLGSCTKDRDVKKLVPPSEQGPDVGSTGNGVTISVGKIKINEYLIKSNVANCEIPGLASDWVELYNTSDDVIPFEAGKWFMTDDLTSKEKWQMPAFTLNPHAFVVIYCNSHDSVGGQYHSNFSLSNNGESLGLAFKSTSTVTAQFIDSLNFIANDPPADNSKGRMPDGANLWQIFGTPTPGSSNQ